MDEIGLVIMAAGSSLRMGKPKLILPLGGKPLLEHSLQKISKYSWGERVAVIGEPREVLDELCRSYGLKTVYNPTPHRGQSFSLKLGINSFSGILKGFVFLPGDQPLISGRLLEALVLRFKATINNNKTIVVPFYGGQSYSPVLFGSGWLEDLKGIEGDWGGRQIIKENAHLVEKVNWDNSRDFIDVDTLEDYEMICKLLLN